MRSPLSAVDGRRYTYGLLAVVTLEILAQTYGFYWQFPLLSSVVYFLAGLVVAGLPMLRWEQAQERSSGKWIKGVAIGLLAFICLWCLWRSTALFAGAPLDYRQADMLPIIETMGRRWLLREEVYAPIEAIWGGMRPIYLPAMWLPFIPAVALGLDIRWVSTGVLLLSAVLIFLGPQKQTIKTLSVYSLLGLVPLALLLYYVFGLYPTLLTLSEEPIVVFYYVLLAWAIHRRKPVVSGFALALCLLSRYALAFWLPMFLVYVFLYRSRREAYITTGALAVSLLLLLTLGQAWDQLGFFLQLQHNYLEELLDPDKAWSFVAQIEKNPGLIKFLPYEYIEVWHRMLLYGSIAIPVLAFWIFQKNRERLRGRFFGLCSLKLSLVYFYNMLTIPYSYLFYPSAFLSLYLLFAVIFEKNKP